MEGLVYENGSYKSPKIRPSFLAKVLPGFVFYSKVVSIIVRGSRLAKRSSYGNAEWVSSSMETLRALESVGIKISITGIVNVKNLDGPCVFVGNHMSTLETFVLPCIIGPIKDITFVVKQSLIDYPVFKYIMRSLDPIAVSRTNPRQDLKAVFDGGLERLRAGRSIVIFPQTTRTALFDPASFNTIGIKLAKKAGVPVIPIALKTDAWGNGKCLKDFGKIVPSRKVYFAFGEPLHIKGRGDEEHRAIIKFITEKLEEWEN